MLPTLDQHLREAEAAHGHLCAGQILGVRMARHALDLLGIADPKGADRKRLVAFVEIDRCATDAIMVVTGCRPGKRALKLRDWGKMAATFCDLATERAVRIVALDSSKDAARQLHPEIDNKNQQQMLGYRELQDDELLSHQWVRVALAPHDLPGYKGERITCAQCGETISFHREVTQNGRTLCRPCADPEARYWQPLE